MVHPSSGDEAEEVHGPMRLARVVGQVVSTVKDDGLARFTLLLVASTGVDGTTESSRDASVAVDLVGAGTGEIVLVVTGSAARVAAGSEAPVDAAVVAIADSVIHDGTVTYRKN